MTAYDDGRASVHLGDCLDVLRTLPDASVDAVVTDPPYGLEFMGKEWDSFRQVDPRTAGRARDVSGASGTSSDNQKDRTTPGGRTGVAFGAQRPKTWWCPECGKRDQFRKHSAKAPNCRGEWEQVTLYADQAPPAILAYGEWCRLWATECLRVLKPGGHLLAFGGTRTWHRLACAVEDAGFEVRDSIAWLYGSGFPKSLDVSKAIDKAAGHWRGKAGEVQSGNDAMGGPNYERTAKGDPITAAAAWDGWGTALKPAFEPVVVARKPLQGTVAANVLTWGTGALNIDATRIGDGGQLNWSAPRGAGQWEGGTFGDAGNADKIPSTSGRWPANVVLDESQAAALDEQSGERPGFSGGGATAGDTGNEVYSKGWRRNPEPTTYGDTGGASRFFYVAKAPSTERPRVDGTAHPTVKPLDLMRWLVRLVTPPGGTVLEPFAGSGTTVEACIVEGFRCIAIEREADYLPLILQRIHRRRDPVAAIRQTGDDLGLFELSS